MPDQALSDVKVLDLTWYIAGPYCTKLLADYGAGVIKVERPGTGDPARSMGPFFKDDPHPEKSGLFLHLNTNKRGITLNLKTAKGKNIFKELVKGVDVLVESFSPRVMPSLGLAYEELEKVNPRLVMTSISNFGQTGPYRDFKASELIIYGMGGGMYPNGLPDREPLKKGDRVIEYQGGTHAAGATMVALIAARTQGVGQQVDISLVETQMGTIDRRMSQLISYQWNGVPSARPDPTPGARFPFGFYPCKDGYWELSALGPLWARFARMLGRPDLADDPRFCSSLAQIQPENKEAFNALFFPWTMERTKVECVEAGQAAGVLCGPVSTPADVLVDPHFKAREFWAEIDYPGTGRLIYPGAPFKSSEVSWTIRRPAPLLGQHNEEVYGALGYTRDDLVKLRERGVI